MHPSNATAQQSRAHGQTTESSAFDLCALPSAAAASVSAVGIGVFLVVVEVVVDDVVRCLYCLPVCLLVFFGHVPLLTAAPNMRGIRPCLPNNENQPTPSTMTPFGEMR